MACNDMKIRAFLLLIGFSGVSLTTQALTLSEALTKLGEHPQWLYGDESQFMIIHGERLKNYL
jgi:hypothetical protein